MASHSPHVASDESGVSNNMENVTATLGADQMADAADATMVDATLTDAIMTDAAATPSWEIFCVVVGEDAAFSIDIRSNATVSKLKDAIKAKKRPDFDRFAANNLKLFQVDVAAGDMSKVAEQIAALELSSRIMNPVSRLNKFYSTAPPEDTIHILVQRPYTGK